MTDASMTLIELLQTHDEGDFLRAETEAVLQTLMSMMSRALIGPGRHERGDGRQTWRNGYRDHEMKTRLGALNLRAPKLRQGSYFPGFLEPRRTSEKALVAFAIVSRTNGGQWLASGSMPPISRSGAAGGSSRWR